MQVAGISAVVTGAASGLGAATSTALAEAGTSVIGVDLAAAWERAPAPADGVVRADADVRDPEQVQAAVDAAVGTGRPLRVVVNCAGVATPSRVLTRDGPHDLDRFATVIGINLIGTFNVLRLAAAAMAATDPADSNGTAGQRGVIVNTASVAAFDGQVGQAAYAASKGGVAAMTLPLARDLAHSGIRVMTIAPGIVDTPMMAGVPAEFQRSLAANVPFPARFGRPDEYAALVLAILANDYLNGEVIRLDGSLRMPPR